ncbi:MAG: ABC transporter permease subunit, partial [Pirellulaceae bacterium]
MFSPTTAVPGRTLRPNRWDVLALLLVLSLIAIVAWGSRQMSAPYQAGDNVSRVSLDAWHLPEYALRSVLRMALALIASLIFTLSVATLAAKNRRAEVLIIPAIDILQSVPILGFLSIVIAGLAGLFPGNLLGVELASIFAIFTSQAWNMTLSFYQSLKIVPQDLEEASQLFGLSSWQRFWKLEVPFATPGLVWNTMMSVSGGWFFVVASEAIAVGKFQVSLPGIGSYVALAIQQKDLRAIGLVLVAMFVVILAYDQLLFRPLVAWSEKFRLGDTASQYQSRSWMLDLFRQTRALRNVVGTVRAGARTVVRPLPRMRPQRSVKTARRSPHGPRARLLASAIIYGLLGLILAIGVYRLIA